MSVPLPTLPPRPPSHFPFADFAFVCLLCVLVIGRSHEYNYMLMSVILPAWQSSNLELILRTCSFLAVLYTYNQAADRFPFNAGFKSLFNSLSE